MVKRKVSLKLALYQNKNEESKAFGKWFAKVDQPQTISTRALCEHITRHGSLLTTDTIQGVITTLGRCIPELISQGIGVKLDGLGIFYPTIAGKGVEKPADFNMANDLEGVRIRFRGDTSALDNISGPQLKKECSLELTSVLQGTESAGNLKRIPYGQYVKDAEAPSGAGGEPVNP